MSIHRRIREGRERLGMTEQQFADAVGVTRGAVQQWEKEDGTAPARKRQGRVAKLIGLSIAELMGQSEEPHHPPALPTGDGRPTKSTTQSPFPPYPTNTAAPSLSDRALDLAKAYDAISGDKRKRDVYIQCIAIIEEASSQAASQSPNQSTGTGA